MTDSEMPPASTEGISRQEVSGPNDTAAARVAKAGIIIPEGGIRNFGAGYLDPDDDARRYELLDAAVGYAERGWQVHPLWHVDADGICACHRSEECSHPGKHPRLANWPQMASSDIDTVAMWWRDASSEPAPDNWYPLANVGIAMGQESGIFALDIDPRSTGDISLAALELQHGELPATRIHQTGSGGVHYLFLWPDFRVGKSASKLAKGVDIQGANSYIVAPPSITDKGGYECVNPVHDIDPAGAPGWLLDILREQDKLRQGIPSSRAARVAPTGIRRAYAKAVIQARARELRETPEGKRNDTLNRCSFALGQLCPDGIIDEETAWTVLAEAASACGLNPGETRRTFRSGWSKGCLSPFYPDWAEQGREWPQRRWNEFGLGDRMVDHYADVLRWCPQMKTWMLYQGGTWQAEGGEAGSWFAQYMIDSLPETEALSYDDTRDIADGKEVPSDREQFLEWAIKQQTTKAVSAADRLCRSNSLMRVKLNACDVDPLLINLRNGTWDAGTGKLLDHDPDRLLTMQAAVSYDPEATCPRWNAFLAQVQPDPEMRAYLYRVWGYSMTADTSEQAMFLHQGNGANGKSVAADVISRILGDYAQTVPVETLMLSKVEGQVPTDVARMDGKRYLTASETKTGKQLDEAAIKQLTGGETVAARYMRANFFEFRPTGKIHLTSNHLVHLSDDPATWRRLHLVPWEQTIEPGSQNKYLAQRLYDTEAAGILNRLLKGLADWRARGGLDAPARAQEAKEQYRSNEDTVGQFIDECLDVSDNETPGLPGSSIGAINSQYDFWCKEAHIKPMAKTTLSTLLARRGFKRDRQGNWRGFPGLTVRFGVDSR